MNILVIPVQSISDLITNSSSEVFILETGKTCKEVNNILKTFTSGFRYPEVFSLKDFREWRKKLRNGEIEEDWSYPGSIFSIAKEWFIDLEDEEDILDSLTVFLFNLFGYNEHSYIVFQNDFIDYLNNNWDRVSDDINDVLVRFGQNTISSINREILSKYSYPLKVSLEDITWEFLRRYRGPKPLVWEIDDRRDVKELDGKVLVVSNDDNSIPYDTWDKINDLFNGWNIHLG